MMIKARADLCLSYRGFVNAPNKVPEHQRNYQAAYRSHTRIWRIVRTPVALWLELDMVEAEDCCGSCLPMATRREGESDVK